MMRPAGLNVPLRGLVALLLSAAWPSLGDGAALRRRHQGAGLHGSTELALQSYHNVQYVADITIGGQAISTLFDTGSSKLVVQSTRCSSCDRPVPPYDRLKSSTYQLSGVIHDLTYGAGHCEILKGFETITVGQQSIVKQAFWEVRQHSIDLWRMAKYAAVAGLGPALGEEESLLYRLGAEEFTVCLGRGDAAAARITFGPVVGGTSSPGDSSIAALAGDAKTWTTNLGRLTVVGADGVATSTTELCPNSECTALLDTGHSLIQGPMDQILKLSDLIHINEDCSNMEELPDLRFELGGAVFELPPHAYVIRVTGADGEEERLWPILPTGGPNRPFKKDTCHPAFMLGRGHWVFGMPFFRYYRTTFSRTEKSMKFVRVTPDCTPQTSANNGTAALVASRRLARDPIDLEPLSVDLSMLARPPIDDDGGPAAFDA